MNKKQLLKKIREESNICDFYKDSSSCANIDTHLLYGEALRIVNLLGYYSKDLLQSNVFSHLPGWIQQDTVDTHPTKQNCELLLKLIRYKNSINLVSIISGLESANYITSIRSEGNVEKTSITVVFENRTFNVE